MSPRALVLRFVDAVDRKPAIALAIIDAELLAIALTVAWGVFL